MRRIGWRLDNTKPLRHTGERLVGGESYSSPIAARTLAPTSGGMSLMLCVVCACSAALRNSSSSVSARSSPSQSRPTSRQRSTFAMGHLLGAWAESRTTGNAVTCVSRPDHRAGSPRCQSARCHGHSQLRDAEPCLPSLEYAASRHLPAACPPAL
jgi:hypothetical protein